MLAQILEEIKKAETIIIHRHIRPDPDAIGSQLGLREVLKATYPEKNIYAVGKNEPSLAFMGTMDQISNEVYRNALVIVNDTANLARIDDNRYALGRSLAKCDHHPNTEPYGDWQWIHEEASSVSELWAGAVLQAASGLSMTSASARLFYLGMVGDTGRFLFDNTSSHTLAIASQLLEYTPFPADDLNHMEELSPTQMELLGEALCHLERTPSGRVASLTVHQAWLQEHQLPEARTHFLVGYPGRLEGVLAWVVFVEQEDGSIRCRLRSQGPAINGLAQAYRGGGHPKASGATVYTEEEMTRMLQDMDHLCELFIAGEKEG